MLTNNRAVSTMWTQWGTLYLIQTGHSHIQAKHTCSFYFFNIYIFLCTLVSYLHACRCEGSRSPGTGVTDRYEQPRGCWCWELNWGPLEKQSLLLITEPFCQSIFSFFSRFIIFNYVCACMWVCTCVQVPKRVSSVSLGHRWLSAALWTWNWMWVFWRAASALNHRATSPAPVLSKGPKAHVKAFWISPISTKYKANAEV